MNIYFSGLGGVGIGPLAEIAYDADYQVQGSDARESLVTDELRARGIAVNIGQDGSYLQGAHNDVPVDWFVYTAALPDDHPELVLARELGIKCTKRDELLAHIISEKNLKLIAIAGTHGKTTTTGMLVWALQQLSVPISYSVGTTLSFGPSGKFDPASQYFIYECDEFDNNFLHFHPHVSLITSIDYDHPDSFPDEDSYLAAFKQFGEQSQQLIGWKFEHGDLFFDHPDAWLLDQPLDIRLPGRHNRHNATLVVKAIEKLGIGGDAYWAINSFPGTNRRFEKLADNLYSDYGHHPVEIAATLQMARELSEHVVLIYQPHQNVRQLKMKDMYNLQFDDAEEIYWLPTYLSREDPDLSIFQPEELIQRIHNKAIIQIADLNDELWNEIQRARDEGKLVLCMGAGSIDGWVREQLAIATTAGTILVAPDGSLLLQQRDDKPGINDPGMLTAFGGSVEEHETPRQGAVRELHEETNLDFKPEDLRYLITFLRPLPLNGQPRHMTYFTLSNVATSNLEIYEGLGYQSIAVTEEATSQSQLTEATILAVNAYKDRSRGRPTKHIRH